MFRCSSRTIGTVGVVDMSGRLLLGNHVALRAVVDTFLGAGIRNIILNLSDVPYMGHAGLGEIVRSYTRIIKKRGKLKLLAPTKRVRDLLAITKLLTVFDIYDTEKEAVASFA